ncbi:dipeptidase PepV [Bacillus sp. FJAT-47783]|uniref:dipeptidase PepV n=1 Tax=Bacillus sp. FJAT-47783 TaxID=2922712 RepID=UPI001FADDFF1|nr:dipeptidase PepV [Bacillus sp. FJAT-47783]
MNWKEEVIKRKDKLISDTQAFLKIKSVLDESTKSSDAPFGKGINDALQFLLSNGEKDGFKTKNVNGYAAHIEMGEGEEIVGILCHIDVVPEGDGWSKPPFGAEIHDGKIYARGALDDKGPTMATYYAMKIVKELGLPLNKRVRMIIGTDEESDWRCVDHYFKHEQMPTIGFAPDADFPIIHAEKGIIDAKFTLTLRQSSRSATTLQRFDSGRRFNMVPDYAKATISNVANMDEVTHSFQSFLLKENVKGHLESTGDTLTFHLEGVSAHAMEPNDGRNAGVILATFLAELQLDEQGEDFIAWIRHYFHKDTRGRKLGIACQDEVSGELTVNVGMIRYEANKHNEIGINIRYPVTKKGEEIKIKLQTVPKASIIHFSNSNPHYVDEKHPLIQTLSRVYEEQTGDSAQLLSIGGGTYARALDAGVAFGPLFPGREDVIHQKDEYIIMDDLLNATAIYAQAIYELAK